MVKDQIAPPPPEWMAKYDDLQWRVEFLLNLLKEKRYDSEGWRQAVQDAGRRIADGSEQ